jgi:phospholipase C
MIVVSPLSIGGFRSSQVYDHTSMLQFMERIFGVEEPNISAWRRQTCGDLTGSLDLQPRRRASFPSLLPKVPFNYLLNQYVNSQDQNPPVVPADQTLPSQEPGTRPPVP